MARSPCRILRSGLPPKHAASGRVLAKAGFTRVDTADRDTETGTVPHGLYALETGGI